MADQEQLITLTADIVAAHVSNNSVSVGDVADLVQRVHGALADLGRQQQPEPAETKRQPAVSPRSSVKPDALTCLVCGSRQTMLKRHLARAHDLTPAAYRDEFGLKADYPMVAPNYAERRRELAVRIGLGRKRSTPARAPGPKRGRRTGTAPRR